MVATHDEAPRTKAAPLSYASPSLRLLPRWLVRLLVFMSIANAVGIALMLYLRWKVDSNWKPCAFFGFSGGYGLVAVVWFYFVLPALTMDPGSLTNSIIEVRQDQHG